MSLAGRHVGITLLLALIQPDTGTRDIAIGSVPFAPLFHCDIDSKQASEVFDES